MGSDFATESIIHQAEILGLVNWQTPTLIHHLKKETPRCA
jgi:hypothetical protein